MIIEGAANAQLFEAYIEKFLAPSLKKGQIVIMDNLSIHKGQKVREIIEACGCRLLFLPAYSPDLSPIEELWSQVKESLRTLAERTIQRLVGAIGTALQKVTASDIMGWFFDRGPCFDQT